MLGKDLVGQRHTKLVFNMKNTIFLIDDDKNILTSVSILLESEGYKVKTFSDGESRAHKEICEKYNIKTSLITAFGQGFPHVHTFFKVVEH